MPAITLEGCLLQSFLSLSTIDIFAVGAVLRHRGVLSSILGLYLPAASNTPSPSFDKQKFHQTLPNVLWEAKSNHPQVKPTGLYQNVTQRRNIYKHGEAAQITTALPLKFYRKISTKTMCNVFMILVAGVHLPESGIQKEESEEL